jgi:hypothetical protein
MEETVSKTPRRRIPFYLRREPKPEYDIRLLRPALLSLGRRFETFKDAQQYSLASEQKLDSSERREDWLLADCLHECRTSSQRCGQPYCPICARRFRIWFIGELLRISHNILSARIHIVTILLHQVRYDQVGLLNVKACGAMLRKRLIRNGLADAAVIGGTEIIYRARLKSWVLHANLVIVGGDIRSIEQFKATFANADFINPAICQQLKDLPEQLSYILKFATYHRPFAQIGSTKGDAKPLNPREHCALVSWMAQWQFQDFMFLFNARREGAKIVASPWSRLKF